MAVGATSRMLIVLGGLPGTGKTTLAKQLSRKTGAVFLRIDAIEQAVRNANVLSGGIGTAGYTVALALALANLELSKHVIVDGVNPVAESRAAFRSVAARAAVALAEIEVICSNLEEHRRRVECRLADIEGLKPPGWASVQNHEYESWATERLVVDTAILSVDEAVARVEDYVADTNSKQGLLF